MRRRWSAKRSASRLAACLLLLGCAESPQVSDPGPLEGAWTGVEIAGRDGTWTLNVDGEQFFLQGPASSLWMRGRFVLEPPGRSGRITLAIEACDCDYQGDRALGLFRMKRYEDGSEELLLAAHEPGVQEAPAGLEPAPGVRVVRFSKSAL